jgi:hypothetical protein
MLATLATSDANVVVGECSCKRKSRQNLQIQADFCRLMKERLSTSDSDEASLAHGVGGLGLEVDAGLANEIIRD